MRTIRISENVWQAIASRGKFGETEEDVLRRLFDLPENSMHEKAQSLHRVPSGRRQLLATQRMRSYIGGNELHVEFQNGNSSSWILPDRNDKAGIRAVLDKAIVFARENGASIGQINAVRKTLTDEDYHLIK